MALIGEIRQRSWLLIVLIGLAMAGFIFMDMFSGERSIFSAQRTAIGEVAGETIDQRQFERAYSALYNNSQGDVFQQRQGLWNFMVEDKLVRTEAREIGMQVPAEELEDLQYGTSLSPIITQRFRDQATGQVNREVINSYKTAELDGSIGDPAKVDPTRRDFWFFQKTEINKQRLQDKMAALVGKSMYTPDWMAEEIAKGQNTRVDFAYAKVDYSAIPDASVTLEDADYQAFMATEGHNYRRTSEGRSIAYVAFDVTPSLADSTAIRGRLIEAKNSWSTAASDSTFVTSNRGTFAPTYLATSALPAAAQGAEVGSIVGPYLVGNSYSITKVVDRMTIADSVASRHILLPASTQEEYIASQSLADSLVALVKAGTNSFDELARQFSTGPTSTKGGDLGYVAPGAMVGPFNDLIFFQADKGELKQVVTQFGLHVVEVTGQKYINNNQGTRIATITEAVEPSTDTQNERYEAASRFAQTNRTVDALRTAAEADPSLTFVDGIIAGANDYIVGALGSASASRDMIKFAFKSATGEVSPNVYSFKAPGAFFDGKYVVTAQTGEIPAGIPSWSAAKSLIKPAVMNMKKAAMIAAAGSDLNAVAGRYGVSLDTARAVNFGSAFIPGVGAEPKVLAEAFGMATNTTSGVIAGGGAAFMIKPLVRTGPGDVSGQTINIRRTQDAQNKNAAGSRFGLALREAGEVSDDRGRFY
ncbi:MAG: peptidylprolyl isomerase [Saprospiraceae bacterium]